MTMAGLPSIIQSQILALIEITKAECAQRPWEDIEPILEAYWIEVHSPSELKWEEVAPYVRTACNRSFLPHDPSGEDAPQA